MLDIGGQDTKAIALRPDGRVANFEMNDKCAAGTGRFLEVMARALGFSLEEMGTAALVATSGVQISSMCTVFAESEVTGLVHRGEDRGRIARGLHEAIARRTVSALRRVGAAGPLVFAGGVARNPVDGRPHRGGLRRRGARARGGADGGRVRRGAERPRLEAGRTAATFRSYQRPACTKSARNRSAPGFTSAGCPTATKECAATPTGRPATRRTRRANGPMG